MATDLQLLFTNPVTSCYPATYMLLLADLASRGVAVFPDTLSTYVVSNSEPSIEDRDKVWFRTDVNGYILHIYRYTNGAWASPHPSPAGSGERRMWTGVESAVWAYDGGDGSNPATTIPTAVSGAMWEVDHAFDGRMPIGPGTLPSTTVIAVGATGGTENVVLTLPQLPGHYHGIGTGATDDSNNQVIQRSWSETGSGYTVRGVGSGGGFSGPFNSGVSGSTNAIDGSVNATAHNNLPPYIGTFMIKRTARTQYIA